MFHVIPGNRLELLVEPLKYLLTVEKANVLAGDWIVLPHRGMQHWLSMELANSKERQICMNLDMQLPASAIWRLIQLILGNKAGSRASDWRRESLTWRIFHLLDSAEINNNPLMSEPTTYWQAGSKNQQELKRFQLSEQLGDLFEQYLIYRPEWIRQWQQESPVHWQALIWQQLVKQSGQHPLDLMDQALDNSEDPASVLPERIFIFAVNNMAPLWLDFLHQLSINTHIDIHLFYLNPSDEYWVDQVSSRQAAKLRAKWFEQGVEDIALETGNSLLSSMGLQGQAFINLLSERADTETPLFIDPGNKNCLHNLQQDLLLLKNTCQKRPVDDSVCITSAYSALREVQGLHDWLLSQFNDNPDLRPRDVLVMCPGIESYAPFIEAVFARGFDHLSESLPPLPCSIADRSLIASDPLVSAFLSFLDLPDDRLQVNQIMSWLNVPAIQEHFGFSQDALEKIEGWLDLAHIHWGLNAQHKSRFLNTAGASETYTWRLGLERLLLGFAWGDRETLVGDRLMLPAVEGDDALILGQLIRFIDRLELLVIELKSPRSAEQWVKLLRSQILQDLFQSQSSSRSFQIIEDCLIEFLRRINESAIASGVESDLDLDSAIVRYYLQQELSRPETTANQYLMGQITFCSMVPMRAVPFKIIAVLGLNEGEYPRQRQTLSFDLMANETMRKGDRSRRGDDRYLFLETIMSAREKLYLSYQGHNIQNNTEKQPSLLLEELMDYLSQNYGWDKKELVRQLPMQPFSLQSYMGINPSFDPVWHRLAYAPVPKSQDVATFTDIKKISVLTPELLIQFFDHPSAFWAKNQLGLYLESYEQTLEDVEPFEANHLQRYMVQQELTQTLLSSQGDDQALEQTHKKLMISGQLPENDLIQPELDMWQQQSSEFYQQLTTDFELGTPVELVEFQFRQWTIRARLPVNSRGELQHWRLADPKPKDMLRIWLYQLIAQVGLEKSMSSRGLYRGKDGFQILELEAQQNAEQILASWLDMFETGQLQPLLLNARIAIQLLSKKSKSFQSIWNSGYFSTGLGKDPYMAYFWPQQPDETLVKSCTDFYSPMFESINKKDIQ